MNSITNLQGSEGKVVPAQYTILLHKAWSQWAVPLMAHCACCFYHSTLTKSKGRVRQRQNALASLTWSDHWLPVAKQYCYPVLSWPLLAMLAYTQETHVTSLSSQAVGKWAGKAELNEVLFQIFKIFLLLIWESSLCILDPILHQICNANILSHSLASLFIRQSDSNRYFNFDAFQVLIFLL